LKIASLRTSHQKPLPPQQLRLQQPSLPVSFVPPFAPNSAFKFVPLRSTGRRFQRRPLTLSVMRHHRQPC
jgi:hypothetical protein